MTDELRKGLQETDLLLPAAIREGLKTSAFGQGRIDYFPAIDSTNVRARTIADAGAPEGTVVVAETQLKGKGRRGRAWFSPAGQGIYVSVILRPPIPPSEAPRIALAAAVAAAEALLVHADLPIRVKWPNDILIDGKKVAGILTEMRLAGDRIDHVVVGMGVNVNTPAESLPPEIGAIATSLRVAAARTFPRAELLRTYLEKLEGHYTVLKERRFEAIRARWIELARIIGKQVKIAGVGRIYEGEVVDIDPTGFLILKTPDGAVQRILAGDVSMIEAPPLPAGPGVSGNFS